MKTLIVLSLLFLTVFAIDPWDVKPKKTESPDKNECNCQNEEKFPAESDIIGDVLYKKLVVLILSKGKFKEIDDNIFDGSIGFRIPREEYEILKKYINSQTRLTPIEIRKIDGILAEYVQRPSKAIEMFQTVWEHLSYAFKHYWIHILITIAAILVLVNLKNLPKISKKHLLWSLVPILYIWEVRNTMEEVENKEYMDEIKRCTYNFIFYSHLKSDCLVFQGGSRLFKVANPLYLIPKLLYKLTYENLYSFWQIFHKINLEICSNLNPISSTLVYTALNTMFLVLFPLLIFALFTNLVFNQSFDFSFLFFNFRLRERYNSFINGQPTQPTPHNANNDDNVASLIGIVKDLIQVKTTEKSNLIPIQNSPPQIPKPQVKYKQRIKKVSSVPDNLSKLGGGDFIRR